MEWARRWCINVAIYEHVARTFTNFMAYRQKKIDRALQRSCAIRIIKNWQKKMQKKGPTKEARQRNTVKYCLQIGYLVNRDKNWDQSKMLLTEFALKTTQIMSMKQRSQEFHDCVSKISNVMCNRLVQHRLKQEHLEILF